MSAQTMDYRSITRPEPSFELYSPAAVEWTYAATDFVIAAKGTLTIRPLRVRVLDVADLEYLEITAKEILNDALGDDGKSGRVGKAGVRVLFGDDRDEMVKADAELAWKEHQYESDTKIQYAHQKAVQVAKDAGQPPPAPDKRVRAAMDRITAYKSENATASPFQCSECAWPFFTEHELSSHTQSSHNGRGAAPVQEPSSEVAVLKAQMEALKEQNTAILTALLTKNKGGRPRKED